MNEDVARFFAFISLIAIGLIVIAFLNRPQGTQAVGSAVFGGFNELLGNLKTVQSQGTPGQA